MGLCLKPTPFHEGSADNKCPILSRAGVESLLRNVFLFTDSLRTHAIPGADITGFIEIKIDTADEHPRRFAILNDDLVADFENGKYYYVSSTLKDSWTSLQ